MKGSAIKNVGLIRTNGRHYLDEEQSERYKADVFKTF
jgi:hypothetical protein